MTKTYNWRLKALVVTVATLATVVVVFVAGEIAVRYRERHRDTVPAIMPFLFYRHARLGHALVRDYSYYGWVHTNPQGFRGTRPVTQEKEAGVFRILAVGGSTTFDSFVSADSAAWPARLERWLQRLAPERRFEVINAGVPGYYMSQDLIRLETELYPYQPDLVILYQGHNDLFGNLRTATVGGRPAAGGSDRGEQRPGQVVRVTPWVGWLEQHSLLYTKLAEKIKLMAFHRLRARPAAPATTAGKDAVPPQPVDDGARGFELMVTEYLSVAQALHLRVVIPEVVHISGNAIKEGDVRTRQIWQATIPFATPETVLQGYQHYNRVLLEVSARFQVPFLSMSDLGIVGDENYAVDDPIHFSDRGADRFAEGLARRLLAGSLLPASGH